MITIWGRLSSVNVQKVVFAAGELDLAFERRDAGGAFGIVNTPAFLALNPNGLVPVLDDAGVVLWESNAIVRYLGARYGLDSIWPHDPARRALCDRWMDWQTTELMPAIGPAFMGLIRTPPDQRDHQAIEASRARAEARLTILDAHLDGRLFLEEQRLTLADITLLPAVHRWLNLPLDREPRPNVERWYEALRVRPAAQDALPLPLT